jgi:hypothetical protein
MQPMLTNQKIREKLSHLCSSVVYSRFAQAKFQRFVENRMALTDPCPPTTDPC